VTDTQRAAPNQPVAFQLQAVLGDEPGERCISITAHDDFGATVQAPDLCLELPARPAADGTVKPGTEAPYEADEAPQARVLSSRTGALSVETAQANAAGGCSVGSAQPARDMSWFLLAMLPFLARRRTAHATR